MKIDVDRVKAESVGKWRGILSELGISVPESPRDHGPCPIENDGKDRFICDDKEGLGTFYCQNCGAGDGWSLVQRTLGLTFMEAVKRVADIVGGIDPYEPGKICKKDAGPALRELYKSSVPLNGKDLASRYLRSRGLVLATKNLRYCDECYEFETKTKMPAMIANIQSSTGEYIGMHRTYLKPDPDNPGKADLKSPKKMMPAKSPLSGGAVRLFDVADCVGIAEGVETAIAATHLFDVPTWACLSTALMEGFVPPEGVRRIVVMSDADANYAGQHSAYELAKKLYSQDYIVDVQVPDANGMDWNDVWDRERKNQ